MKMWISKLFEQDIRAMNYMQLADWLTACRNTVRRENFDTYLNYISAVDMFCHEWEEYHILNNNENIVHHSKFKKALLYAQYKDRLNVQLDYGTGKEKIPVDTYHALKQSIVGGPLLSEIEQDFSTTYEYVQAIVEDEANFKNKLHEELSKKLFNERIFYVRVFRDGGKQIKAATYQEAIALCEQESKYKPILKRREKKVGFYAAFKDFDISPTVYTEYMAANTCEQEFNKKFFVNLAFLLGLNATDAEKLLNYNGYSMLNKLRQFDIICEKALRIGFGREYAIALIDKYNYEKSRQFKVFKPIANLTKNRNKVSYA